MFDLISLVVFKHNNPRIFFIYAGVLLIIMLLGCANMLNLSLMFYPFFFPFLWKNAIFFTR